MTPRLVNADWNYWPEERSAAHIWASSAAIGFDAIELGVYEPAVQLSDERVATYQALAAEHSLPVATALYSMPPDRWPEGGLGNPDHAPLAIDAAITTARIAHEAFGCTLLGLWPGADTLDRSTSPADVWPVMVRSFRAIADNVAELGMEVAVEYKPHEMLANADAALRLCDAVDSAALGVLLDTGHALWVGEDLPVVVRLIGDRLKHGTALKSMSLVRPLRALDESLFVEYMLRDSVRGLRDGQPIALARAMFKARRDELLRHAPSGDLFVYPQKKEM